MNNRPERSTRKASPAARRSALQPSRWRRWTRRPRCSTRCSPAWPSPMRLASSPATPRSPVPAASSWRPMAVSAWPRPGWRRPSRPRCRPRRSANPSPPTSARSPPCSCSAALVPGSTSFDDIYESADTFADVYAEITERLVAAATEHGDVLYAVPGSPLVLERSVRRLRDDDRIECTVLPAMSFLDVAFARLGIDPIESAVRLIDGHEFVTAAAGDRGPMFVAQTHANWVLSDINLAVESATGDEPLEILQR